MSDMIEEKMMMHRSEVISLLQAHDVSPTQQRIEIAQLLFSKQQHITAEEVLISVNREKNLVSKATVYNTLGLFANSGLIKEIFVEPTKVIYDSNTEPHHHFYDVDSGELMDVPGSALQLAALPELPEGAELEGVDVIIRVRRSESP